MKKWVMAVPALAAAAVLAAGIGATDAHAQKSADRTIADRIYIGEVSVGGMTADEASKAVTQYVEGLAEEKVILQANNVSVEATVEELGLSWKNTEIVEDAAGFGKTGNLIARYKSAKDLEHGDKVFQLALAVDEPKTTAWLEEHVGEMNREAVDFGLKRENGEFQITGGEDGIEVNVEKSTDAINTFFAAGWTKEPAVQLVAEISKPKGSREELSRVKDKLGSYSTDYSSSASGRKKNVANGCAKIDGSVIYPGETFSVYEAVSPFDEEHGYALAGSYENGTTVETYGGGICQVSTTLYNAVIRAELEIVERYGHSMIVNYVDPSSDAAIAGTSKDLKFKNNLSTPIYIEGYADGSEIGFTIYGEETRPENREVSFVSETTGTTEPTVEYKASGDAIGSISKTQSSHTGKTARLWKIVTVNGQEESREVFNNTTYQMSPTIYSVGTASSSSDATAAMNAAIATQDGDAIRAAAAKWSDSAIRQREAEAQAEADRIAAEQAAAQAEAERIAAEAAAQQQPQTDPAANGTTGESVQ